MSVPYIPETFYIVEGGILFAVVVAGALVYGIARRTAVRETISIQDDNIKALKDQADIHANQLREIKIQNDEQKEQINKLQNQIEVIRDLPLKSIDKNTAQLAKDYQRITNVLTTVSETVGAQQLELSQFIKHKTTLLNGLARLAASATPGQRNRAIDKEIRRLLDEMTK